MIAVDQIVLDPRQLPDRERAPIWHPNGPVPPDLRKFGWYPQTEPWLPGDLILLHSVRPSLISRLIISGQHTGGYPPVDARWHHAAVYVGDDYLCEATLCGVRYRPIYSYVGARLIRVRRDPRLKPDQRYKIAITAMARLRRAYSWIDLLRLGVQSLMGFWRPRRMVLGTFGLICSQLYADAYQATTGRVLTSGGRQIATPADLSLTEILVDVQFGWKRIV